MTLVVVEDPEAGRYLTALAPHFPAVRFTGLRDAGELLARLGELREPEVLITKGRSVRADILEQLPALRWVQSLLAGVDRFAPLLESRPDVILTSTRGMHAAQMGEMVLMQMLVLARDVPRSVRNQQQRAWERWYPRVLHGKCVVVVGLGTSGREVGRVCLALGMRVIAVSRSSAEGSPFGEVYGYDSIARAASLADFLVLATSHRPDTDRLIDADVLSAMKPGAFLINVARGRIVDEGALADALQADGIAGAALDVFRIEPLPESSPLWHLPNVFLTPHLAGRSEHYVAAALELIRPNLSCYLAGRFDAMTNRVDANAGRS